MIKYLSEGAYDYLDSESWEYDPDFGIVENMYHKFPEMDFYNEVNLNDDKIAFFFDGYGDTEEIKDFLDGAGLEYRIGKAKNYKNKINLIVYVQMPDGYTEDEERIDALISAMEKFGYWYNATDSDDDMPVFRHNGQSVSFHGGWDEVEEWIDELEQDALYDEDLYESRKRMKESYKGQLTNLQLFKAILDVTTEDEWDHHESDLYCKITPQTREIAKQWRFADQVETFRDQITGEMWYDFPFAYVPYWKERGF